MSRAGLAVLFAALLVAPAAGQVNLTGDWDMTIESPQGTNTVKVSLTQDGEKLSGLFKSEMGELPFTGTIVGVDVKFAFAIPIQGQSLDIAVTGKVDGQTLAGKMQFGGFGEGDWTAKRAAAAAATTTAPRRPDRRRPHRRRRPRRRRPVPATSGTSRSRRRTAISRPS
jgi:hypothetical protein